MGNDLFKIQRLAGCGINLLRWSNFSILSLQTRDHLLPLSFFSLSSFFFPLHISFLSPSVGITRCTQFRRKFRVEPESMLDKDTKKISMPAQNRWQIRVVLVFLFFLPFLFHPHYSFSPIFVATLNGRIAESGADRIGDANKYVRAI